MLCCFFIKLPFKGLGATAGKVRAVAFDTVWGLARFRLCGRPNEGGRNTKAKLAIKQVFHPSHATTGTTGTAGTAVLTPLILPSLTSLPSLPES